MEKNYEKIVLSLALLLSTPVWAAETFVGKDINWWQNASQETVKNLIQNGANINAQEDNGMTALMIALSMNQNPEISEMLIKNGANVKLKDNDNKTALDYARENPFVLRTNVYRLLQEKYKQQ